MIDVIKEICKNYLSNADLSTMQYGTVVNTNPIQIKIDKIVLPSSKIIVPTVFKRLEISFKVGDKVLLLKQHGGQLFVVLDIA